MHVPSPAERFLEDFHQRRPGTTSTAFAHLRSEQHESSYAALAATLPDSSASLSVLDLACGNGYLLALLEQLYPQRLQLVGVDISQAELDEARTRLPGSACLLKERAQALSIGTASVDVVVSHLALMLMDDIELVLSEIRRVLRKDGKVAIVVGRGFLLGAVGDAYLQVFRQVAQQDALAHLPMGDPRMRTEEGWRGLFSSDFDQVTVQNIDVSWQPDFAELWQSLSATYDVDRLTPAARGQLQERFKSAIDHLPHADGTFVTGWGLRLIQAHPRPC
ncbi:class I SAM-dependent methyltransferase [Pseudomonas sp. RA_35y_Pfl2_P32]|uniref:class I SAM-dependent methyltransferase n=1 Tax=Pseudomonas sp. RA_35y_Pfl2_P32 TaxID=3088705 RepID=UPI0030D96608